MKIPSICDDCPEIGSGAGYDERVTTTISDRAELSGPVVGRIRGLLPNLSRTGSVIGAAILVDPSAIVHMTVTDLAAHTGTSVGSVVRFCQDMGFRGFQDLKLRIATESVHRAEASEGELTSVDSPQAALPVVLRSSAKAITDAADTVDPTAFTRVADALTKASHLLVVGVGTSAPLAQDAAYRFRTIGLLAEAPADTHAQHVIAKLMQPNGVCLAISHTGQTRETLTTVAAAKHAGATTIAITSFYRSPLTDLCGFSLVAGSAETHYRIEAMTSRFAHIAVLDALHTAVRLTNPARAQRAQDLTADALTDHRI